VRYLVQILIQLKRMGLVTSSRGKQGGYNLAKPPNWITLGEVVRHMTGPLFMTATGTGKKDSVFSTVWKEAEEALAEVLDKITFEDIANKTKDRQAAIIYQI
jgi:Rrf2 family cysteine metabolism transcriptional repressor